ncbi:MAG: glycosyltransferase family 9 protein [Phycisphaerales bacterium]
MAVHPGSGGEQKCWPADRYESLIEKLKDRGQPVRPLLGEAEADRWPDDVIQRWQKQHGAEVFGSLDQLHVALAAASAYIGNDSGPTHLAAQMGLPTVALFGPTPPSLWAPVGPSVTVLAPPAPAAMDWLSVDAVLDACPQPA